MKEDIENNELRAREVLRILSDKNSLVILERILVANTCICGDFIGVLDLEAAELVEQLKRMESSGMLLGKVDGAKICYCLNPEVVTLLESIFHKEATSYTAHKFCNEC